MLTLLSRLVMAAALLFALVPMHQPMIIRTDLCD